MALPIDIFLTASAGFKTDLLDDKNERKVFVECDFEQTSSFIDITEFVEKVDISSKLRSDIGGFTGATTNTAKISFRNDLLSDGTRPFSAGFFAAFNASTFHFNGTGVSNPGGGGFSSSLKIGNLRAGREIKIKATVGEGNETITIFTGFVDKQGFIEKITNTDSLIEISLHDRSKDLIDTKAVTKSALAAYTTDDDELIFVNLKVCDSTDVTNSLVHRIAEIGGVVAGDIISEDLLNVVPFVKLTKNVWPELSELAEAYNALLYFDGDGKLRFVRSQFNLDVIANDTFPPSVVEHTWDKNNTNSIDKKHIDVFANKVQVSGLIKQAAATKEIIYNFIDDQTYNAQLKESSFVIPIPAAPTQPDITNPNIDFFAEFQTEDNEKVNLAIDIDAESEAILKSSPDALTFSGGVYDVFANKVQIRLVNVLTQQVKLNNLIIRGKPVRDVQVFNIFEIASAANLLEHGEKLVTINNKYFDSPVTAGSLAAFVRDFGSEQRQAFTIKAPAVLHMQAGAWIKLVLDDTTISDDVDIYCRVESYNHNFVKHGLQTSTIELVAYIFDWTDSTTDNPKIISGSTTTNFRAAELAKNPFVDDDRIPPDSELWDFAQRTTSSLGRRPTIGNPTLIEPFHEFQPVRTGYRGAIGVFNKTKNELFARTQLNNPGHWTAVAGSSVAETIFRFKQFRFFRLTRPATASGTQTGIEQNLPVTIPDGVYSVQLLLLRGTHTADSQIILRDNTAAVDRIKLEFNWTTKVLTQTTGTGELIEINSDTFLIKGTTATAVVAANDNFFRIFDINETVAKTWFATAAQIEQSEFSTPFIYFLRQTFPVQYQNYLLWNNLAGIQFWIRPFFNFDSTEDKIFFDDFDGSTTHISFIYDATADKFKALIFDGVNTATVSIGSSDGITYNTATAFTNNAALNRFTHIHIVWDVVQNIFNVRINGNSIASVGGSPGVLTSVPFNEIISMGGNTLNGLKVMNSYLFDFICVKTINTAGNLDRHFDLNKPWINEDEIANTNATNRAAITSDVVKGDTAIQDNEGRLIEVGESKGVFATDGDGNTLHDLPDRPLPVEGTYGGHLFLLNKVAKAFTVSRTTVGGATGTPTDHDISLLVSEEITNFTAVWVRLKMRVFTDVAVPRGSIIGRQRFGFTFGALPAAEAENICAEMEVESQDVIDINETNTNFCIIPVTRDSNGVPHITERLELAVSGTTVAPQGVDVDFIIMGFLT